MSMILHLRSPSARRCIGPSALALALFLGAAPAEAQSLFWWLEQPSQKPRARYRAPDDERPERRQRPKPQRASRDTTATPVSAPTKVELPKTSATLTQRVQTPPLLAIISIGSQRLTVYDQSGVVVQSPISSGQAGHRTPTGVFSVIQKNRYHHSNIYSGAPMPYMQRITWSGIAFHEGRLPGYPASHGCIRLPNAVAAKMFEMTKLGMRVVVAPSDTSAQPFSHQGLPEPIMTPATLVEQVSSASSGDAPLVQKAAIDGQKPAGSSLVDATVVEPRLVSPQQRAIEERARVRTAVVATKKAVPAALDASQKASALANQTDDELKAARVALRAAEAKVVTARSAEQAATTPEARESTGKALADAEAAVTPLKARTDDLAKLASEQSDAAFDAAKAYKRAVTAAEDAEASIKKAEKAVEPVSIFVSRKEGKLFVRQGFEPMLEVPVTIRDANPLGTHVYVALAGDQGSTRLSWTSVSVPASGASAEADDEDAPRRKRGKTPAPEVPRGPQSSATEALSRIEIDPDTRKWIGERLWVGASLIISDQGISNETGAGTDFVVLTK